MKEEDPQRLGVGLERLVDRLAGKGRGSARASLVWAETVGAGVARHTHVVGVRDGELLVNVDSPAWATELSAMSEHLLENMRKELGQGTVRNIRFTVSQEVEKQRTQEENTKSAARRYGGSRVTPKALGDEQAEELEGLFEEVKDPRLREAAIRAMKRDLEWKKGVEASERRED